MPGTSFKNGQALGHAGCGFKKWTRVWSCRVWVSKMDKDYVMPGAGFKNGQGFRHAGCGFQKWTRVRSCQVWVFIKWRRVWSCRVRVSKMDKGLGMQGTGFKNGQGFGHARYGFL